MTGALVAAGWYAKHKAVSISLQEKVLQIPYIDAVFLELFFRKVILRDSLGYTLIGEKPMSFGVLSGYTMRRGWEIWEKYKHHFANSRFEFWVEEATWTDQVKFVVLMDKHQLSKVFEENIQDFQLLLGTDVSINRLLGQLPSQPFLKQILKNQEALIGICLGYGRTNAWWYHNRDKSLMNPSVWEKEYHNTFPHYLMVSFCPWKKYQIEELALPGFVGEANAPETMLLKQRYVKARRGLIDYYTNKNFLEATLSLFAKE